MAWGKKWGRSETLFCKFLDLVVLRYDLLIKLNISVVQIFRFPSKQHKSHGIRLIFLRELRLSKRKKSLWCYEWHRINGTLLCIWTGTTHFKQAGWKIHPAGWSWSWMENTALCWFLVQFKVHLLFDNCICKKNSPVSQLAFAFDANLKKTAMIENYKGLYKMWPMLAKWVGMHKNCSAKT